MIKSIISKILISILLAFLYIPNSNACTGICLHAKDGGVVYGRTMEWGTFDLNSRIAIVPRDFNFVGLTPDGFNGLSYNTKYGFVGLDLINTNFMAEGLNEQGLSCGMFYFSGAVDYADYNQEISNNCLTSLDLVGYILSQFKDVNDVKEYLNTISLVGVIQKEIGTTTDLHWMINDKSGASVVIELVDGKFKFFNAELGVCTNKPSYDWHVQNVRNYVNLQGSGFTTKNFNGLEIKPTGHGTGLLGLPGDNTPPSRFIRATIWSQLARELDNAEEAIYEMFRILDNFQLPLGKDSAEGDSAIGNSNNDIMRSSTIWTVAWNLTDLTLNYHTQHNRRVRRLNFKEINFDKIGDKIIHLKLDKEKKEDIDEITIKI